MVSLSGNPWKFSSSQWDTSCAPYPHSYEFLKAWLVYFIFCCSKHGLQSHFGTASLGTIFWILLPLCCYKIWYSFWICSELFPWKRVYWYCFLRRDTLFIMFLPIIHCTPTIPLKIKTVNVASVLFSHFASFSTGNHMWTEFIIYTHISIPFYIWSNIFAVFL